MTGNQLKEILNICGLNQKQAAEALGVSEVTMSKQVNKGDERISRNLAQSALLYAMNHCSTNLLSSMIRLQEILNQLQQEVS